MRRPLAAFLALALITVASGCGTKEQTARASITMAQSTLDQQRDKALEITPAEFAAIQDSIDAARASLSRGEPKAALRLALSALSLTKAMTDSLPGREQELRAEWERMQVLAAGLDQFHKRLDDLNAMHGLPGGLSKDQLDSAKAALGEMTEKWVAAQNSFHIGKLAQAVAEAGAAKQMLLDGMNTLGMAPSDSLRT